MCVCVHSCSYDADYAQLFGLVKDLSLKNCASGEFSTFSTGECLREERNRLGLKQEELAQIGGVNRNTQGSYEKDERRPDSAYLRAIAAAGVDVLYVITGGRTPAPIEDITAEEETLLRQYRSIPADDKKGIRRFLKALADDAAGSRN